MRTCADSTFHLAGRGYVYGCRACCDRAVLRRTSGSVFADPTVVGLVAMSSGFDFRVHDRAQ